MITEVAEHSVDLDLLPNEDANILDLGCRGFGFSNYFNKKHHVYPVDIDVLPGEVYYQIAISHINGKCGISISNDPQATCMREGNEIEMKTIKTFSEESGVDKWDLIKMDVEGAEYEILNNSFHPMAKQVSVEFHAHCTNQTKETLDSLLDYLSAFYTIHNRVWESRHGAGFNYWDVLLISK